MNEELPADMIILAIENKQEGPTNKRVHWAMNEVQVTGTFLSFLSSFFLILFLLLVLVILFPLLIKYS